ncbi:MAG: hypothetical protein HFG29_06020 [Eubacterium sp.]|nr:hypothetical protein [Eubacterium sp.]
MMKKLYKATMYRMMMSTGVRVSVMLTYVAAVLYYVLAWMVTDGKIDAAYAESITGLGDSMILWFFGSLIVGVLVGGDFENKTIHASLHYGRGKVIINYMLVFATLMFVLLVPYTIGSVYLITSGTDMRQAGGTVMSIYMENVLSYTTHVSVVKIIFSYLAGLLVYIGQIAICIPVALKCRKTVVVTAFGFLFGMLTAMVATLAQSIKTVGNIYQFTPYDYGISKIGCLASGYDIISGIVVSIVFAMICTVGGWLLFRRADVK